LKINKVEYSGIHTLVFATNNLHKVKEIRDVIGHVIRLLIPADLGFNGEIPEEKDTIEKNAVQKARFVYDTFGLSCFADDTGLEIDALNGAPGVYSARYAGAGCTFDDNMNKVLAAMTGIKNRKAIFRTVIALIENERLITFQGEIQGVITTEKRGKLGFGYDPIFLPDGHDRTFAEMEIGEKNHISHRALAVKKLIDYLSVKFA
jgi:XTP/dITP diphosphohydrolase